MVSTWRACMLYTKNRTCVLPPMLWANSRVCCIPANLGSEVLHWSNERRGLSGFYLA